MKAEGDLLADVTLFQFLDAEERTALAAKMESVRYSKGEIIFRDGDPGDAMYLVESGEAEVFFKNDTGECLVLEVARRGSYFGELSLLDHGSRSASVRVTQNLTALRLNREQLDTFLRAHPQAALDLLTAMGRRLRVSSARLRHTATRNVNEEVADRRTRVQKIADWIAEFAGSLTFLGLHIVWFSGWLLVNSVKLPGIPQFDPFPFGFLTLAVSLEAIFLSVFVLLSQNRQAAKDRVRSDIEYDVNLKAEMEIVHLHEKVDRLTCDVLLRLDELKKHSGDSHTPTAAPGSGGNRPAA